MKNRKIAVTLMLTAMILGNTIPAFAYQPKIIGKVLSTDIIAYIDRIPIRSYNYQDHTYVMAEDLRNYGFQVDWNGKARALNITLPAERVVKQLSDEEKKALEKQELLGTKRFDVYQTDIQVLFDGKPIPSEDNIKTSINVNGNTLVLLSAMKHFGDVDWHGHGRTSELHTKGGILPAKTCTTDFGLQYQEIERIPANYYSFKSSNNDPVFDRPVYASPTINNKDFYERMKILDELKIGVIEEECITLDKDGRSIYYIPVNKQFLDIFQLTLTQIDDNKLQLKSALDTGFIAVMEGGGGFEEDAEAVYKINFSLYKDGKTLEMPDFPTFLSMHSQLYINSVILAEVMGLKDHNGDELGYGRLICATEETKTLSYWLDIFAKEETKKNDK